VSTAKHWGIAAMEPYELPELEYLVWRTSRQVFGEEIQAHVERVLCDPTKQEVLSSGLTEEQAGLVKKWAASHGVTLR
jgi:hypothetical protein